MQKAICQEDTESHQKAATVCKKGSWLYRCLHGRGRYRIHWKTTATDQYDPRLFEQQDYMYRNNTHSVKDRIVSISQSYIRLIVRRKGKAPTEFGAKLYMSIDERGIARLERLSFDAYNRRKDTGIQRQYRSYRSRKRIQPCKALLRNGIDPNKTGYHHP